MIKNNKKYVSVHNLLKYGYIGCDVYETLEECKKGGEYYGDIITVIEGCSENIAYFNGNEIAKENAFCPGASYGLFANAEQWLRTNFIPVI